MKTNTLRIKNVGVAAALIAIAAVSIGGVGLAMASDNTGKNYQQEHRGGMHMGQGGFSGRSHFAEWNDGAIPEEAKAMRAAFRSQMESLSYEERVELFENRQAFMQEHKNAMEGFLGLSREEAHAQIEGGATMSEILDAEGISQSDAEEFLSSQMENRIEKITGIGVLDSEQEAQLQEVAEKHMKNLLDAWFSN